ncbi:hypothetical protein KIW84_056093 [Lathyrus oleraceus]|uniref:Uncharacterized protein n=1 Tax=Pisum sativum TaxID=3888 RepID=A0A9D4X0A4_PEA|nr:hypothetical protein KIW84_056093 [Pisum sativum]
MTNNNNRWHTRETRNLDEGRRSDKVPWCDHCKHESHTRETCWKLKSKLPNWKKKSGRAFQASNSDQGQQPPPSQFPLTTEQLDRPYKLLESPIPSCSIATKDNSVFLNDLNSGKMISNAKEIGGLYYLDIGSASQLPSKIISSCFESFSVLNNKDDNIMLCPISVLPYYCAFPPSTFVSTMIADAIGN